MGLSKEKAQDKKADTLLATSTAATDKAATEDPALKEMRDYYKSIVDWDTGASGKPIDIHDLPGSGVDIGLFEDALRNRDAGRVGRGFGTATDNANPEFAAALGQEMENERKIEASGRLEDVIGNKVAEARAGLTGVGTAADARNLNVASLRTNLYDKYLNRPRNPGLFEQLIGPAAGAAGQLGAGALSAGGWAGLFAT